jgi:hypothetical protein
LFRVFLYFMCSIRIVDKLLQLSPKLIECRNTDGSSIITLAVQKKYWSIVKVF